jgi:hypothetical protein
MNTYTFRKERDGAFKTWRYDYIRIEALRLPEYPTGYRLFTITKSI